ncbi:HlyD family secretion protein [Pseudomarimonas salicorniae]|uniref:HlyD family efflux transporter periplasmic adaptor subunit n=1 Tax=Pseudomarimonas salicorniae TaxID=2933270 RepID=A0ABT0GCW4_9GAMM|nr:HlyD family secretion protein [Lysobacter sp. CAU 1642]MCK7592383.1 HlyD family efflux transporter periplasmic adaptor subunit [Lysobacter sp. CAU 1642]
MRRLFVLLALLPLVAAANGPLRLEGEIVAQRSASLAPPSIEGMWNYSITFLAPDGTPVKQGQPVLGFDGNQLQTTLQQKQSALKEKLSQSEKLALEHAARERDERIATEQARANRDKAQRKASQPEDLLRGIEYRKLVVDREHNEALLALAERRELLAAEQRRQERAMLDAEIAQLRREVAQAEEGLAALQLKAPRDGLLVHRGSWNGEKFDVGSQVWRGQTVAEIPDPATLAVRASLPEVDYLKVRQGQPARVTVEGSGASLVGSLARIGQTVRSRSRLQPVPVVELLITVEGDLGRLKPGQAVRVELDVQEEGA